MKEKLKAIGFELEDYCLIDLNDCKNSHGSNGQYRFDYKGNSFYLWIIDKEWYTSDMGRKVKYQDNQIIIEQGTPDFMVDRGNIEDLTLKNLVEELMDYANKLD